MEPYQNWESTPLKWHKFVTYVSLPLGFLGTIGQAADLIEASRLLQGTAYAWYGAVNLLFLAALLGLTATAFVGQLRRRWYGPRALLCSYLCSALFLAVSVAVGISVGLGSPELVASVTSMISTLIVMLLNGIYYKKRRLLFAPRPGKETEAPAASEEPWEE